jgi:hypothetical protein
MSGNTYAYIALGNNFTTLIQRVNNVVSELNTKTVKFDVNNDGKRLIISANVAANGTTFTSTGNTTLSGANTNIAGGTFLVNSNTNFTGTVSLSGTLLTSLINDKIQVANADVRYFRTDTTSESVTSNTTFSGANTNFTGATLLSSSNVIFSGANTTINGTLLTKGINNFVGSNTNLNGSLLVKGTSKYLANTDFDDNALIKPEIKDYSITLTASGNTGATETLDLTNGNAFSATVNASCTFTFSNPPITGKLGEFVLIITNGGSSAVTWPASVDWPAATVPTLTTAGVDVLTFITQDAGTTWLGFTSGLDLS